MEESIKVRILNKIAIIRLRIKNRLHAKLT